MSFFKRGYEQLDDIEKKFEERRSNYFPFRFWLPADDKEEREIVFLTDDPPIIEEHNLRIDGDWRNWFTCPKNADPDAECPLCEAGNNPYTVGFYVILDRTGYVATKGENRGKRVGKDQVYILPAKFGSLKEFKRFSTKFGGLEGRSFDVQRTDSGKASIGDSWIYMGKNYSPDELEEIIGKSLDEVVPDWEEYLAIKPMDELAALVNKQHSEYTEEDLVNFSD